MKTLVALIKKEFLQIIRDPSSIIIAFVLPLISILIYMYGVNLDSVKVTLGIKNDDANSEISTLVKSFGHSKYVDSMVFTKFSRGQAGDLLIITDGSEVNTANYVQSYSTSIANNWLNTSKFKRFTTPNVVNPELRIWYNQDLNSHYFILPGSISITMTLIGILLTALVVAREWERGTMEALLSTQVKKIDIVLGKYIPYFTLGMTSMIFNVFLCVGIFKIPFRGNYLVLFAVSGLFLFTLLGVGLLISSKLKNQFLASQVSLGIGFLPALLLSGLMFPINSMPKFFQILTGILPPRYFITFIESEFMAGGVNSIRLVNAFFLTILGLILFALVYKSTDMRLESK